LLRTYFETITDVALLIPLSTLNSIRGFSCEKVRYANYDETEGTVHIVCSEACEQVERNTVSGSISESIKGGPLPHRITLSSLI